MADSAAAETTVSEITALEDRRWAAQIAGDLDALDVLLADELSYTHSNGMVDTKASYIEAIAGKVFDYQSESRSDVKVEVVGDTAMVTGRVAMTVLAGGRTVELDSRYTVVWIRRDGSWQLLCWQSTPIA